jgi:hypothetical protein
MAEEKVLETNALGGEQRSAWYDCANWRSGSFTQDCAPFRQAETGPLKREHSASPNYAFWTGGCSLSN